MRLLPESGVSAVSAVVRGFPGRFRQSKVEGVSGYLHRLGLWDAVSALTGRGREAGFMALSDHDFRTVLSAFCCPGIALAADWRLREAAGVDVGAQLGPSTFSASLSPLRGDFSPL